MKTLFQLGDQSKNVNKVLCEWSRQHCCLAGFDSKANQLSWLTYNTYDQLDEATIQTIINEVTSSGTIIVSSAFPESIFTPLGYNGEEVLQNLYNSAKPVVALSDNVNEWQVKNHYLLPKAIHNVINHKFSNVSYINFFTVALKGDNGIVASEQIAVHFSPNQFSVLVKKSGQLQLAQLYSYQSPLDVVYYLMKIVDEFNLSKEETVLIISGLIEESSDLYREMYQYFPNIQFATSTMPSIEGDTYPSHFFTSIYNLAACVS
ncbi:DUF3822 family protein [Flavisolibacter tropicus]|uniref:DUF3822 family protein n=1 Tax=Flavisolibacter tropicus TaxID=1492898 RepID=UPI001315009D|nr:DUF3822 family protein [Flavisolibacter tropicus]